MNKMKVYLDNGATTKVDEEVMKEMQKYFVEDYGNASSLHSWGQKARDVVENARKIIADKLKAKPEEIIFTSGGTESDNLAIRGVCKALEGKKYIVASQIEHPAVMGTCADLCREGYKIKYVKVGKDGIVDIEELKKELNSEVALVSIMHANNEVGTIQPIKEIYSLCKSKGIIFHTDACQSFTKIELDSSMADLITISGHKIHGPKGIGALYIKKGTPIKKIQTGGHHEKNMRAGTEPVPLVAGVAKAAEVAVDYEKVKKLRDRLIDGLLEIEDSELNGDKDKRLPNNVNITFHRIEGESLLLTLDEEGIACSTGSACSSHSLKPSHVLLSMGLEPVEAHGSLRFTLSKYTTSEEIDYVIKKVKNAVEKLRGITAL